LIEVIGKGRNERKVKVDLETSRVRQLKEVLNGQSELMP
jgi:hypothetical protein